MTLFERTPIMIPVLSIVLPVFGLIGLGVVGGKSRLFPEAAVVGLSNFVLYVAVPALLFRTIVRSRPFEALNLDIVYAYYAPSFVVLVGALLLGRFAFGLSGASGRPLPWGRCSPTPPCSVCRWSLRPGGKPGWCR